MRLNKIVNGIVSAWKSGSGNNANNNILLERILKQHRFKYHKLLGKYGNIEPSFFVYDIPLNTLIDLGRRFNQESVIIIDENGTYLYHLQDNKLDAFSHEHRFKGIKKFLSKQDNVSYDRNIDESFYYDDIFENLDMTKHLNPFNPCHFRHNPPESEDLIRPEEFIPISYTLYKIVYDYQRFNPNPHFFSKSTLRYFGNTLNSFKAIKTDNPRYVIVVTKNKTMLSDYTWYKRDVFYVYDFNEHTFTHIDNKSKETNPELYNLVIKNLPAPYLKKFMSK